MRPRLRPGSGLVLAAAPILLLQALLWAWEAAPGEPLALRWLRAVGDHPVRATTASLLLLLALRRVPPPPFPTPPGPTGPRKAAPEARET